MTDTRYLSARVLQIFGLVLLLACFVYWALTKEQSELFVGAAITLISAGSVQGFRVTTQLMRDAAVPATTAAEDPPRPNEGDAP